MSGEILAPDNPKMTTVWCSPSWVPWNTSPWERQGCVIKSGWEGQTTTLPSWRVTVFWNGKASEKCYKKEVQKSGELQRSMISGLTMTSRIHPRYFHINFKLKMVLFMVTRGLPLTSRASCFLIHVRKREGRVRKNFFSNCLFLQFDWANLSCDSHRETARYWFTHTNQIHRLKAGNGVSFPEEHDCVEQEWIFGEKNGKDPVRKKERWMRVCNTMHSVLRDAVCSRQT